MSLAEAHALRSQGRHVEAIGLLEQATRDDPSSAEAWATLGSSYFHLHYFNRARLAFERTVALAPRFAEGWSVLGDCRVSQGDIIGAMEAFDAAHRLRADPDASGAGRLFYMCFHPEGYLRLPDASKAWGAAVARTVAPLLTPPPRPAGARIRVGYLSEEFGSGATSYFFEPVLARHDRDRVDVFVYGATPALARHAEHARDIAGRDPRAIAEQVRADAIDILVLVTSYRARYRLPLAYKPAPIQVCYSNLASTSGLAAADYLITEEATDPIGLADALYAEKLVRVTMRNLYSPPADSPPVSRRPLGAPVTFGSFNNIGKITPSMAETWARILTALPDARLHIKSVLPMAEEADWDLLKGIFARAGMPLDRVSFLPTLPTRSRHLEAYGALDIALDPFPCNGGTSSWDALWMGVPIVTRQGETFVARQTAALLAKLGYDDLIARDDKEYVAIALRLAQDAPHRAAMREAQRALVQSRLIDYGRHVAELEAAYQVMWTRHLAGEPPSAFSVSI